MLPRVTIGRSGMTPSASTEKTPSPAPEAMATRNHGSSRPSVTAPPPRHEAGRSRRRPSRRQPCDPPSTLVAPVHGLRVGVASTREGDLEGRGRGGPPGQPHQVVAPGLHRHQAEDQHGGQGSGAFGQFYVTSIRWCLPYITLLLSKLTVPVAHACLVVRSDRCSLHPSQPSELASDRPPVLRLQAAIWGRASAHQACDQVLMSALASRAPGPGLADLRGRAAE
jgi:hypothetical protein